MRLLPIALLVALAACGPRSAQTAAPVYDRVALPRAELATRPGDNMFAIVRALRPNWLVTPMGASGISNPASAPVKVFVDGNEFGEADMLKSIASNSVESARYYTTTEAQSKYGLRVSSPVIAIVTRRP